jgi:CheY-like chemotaxis protein
MARVLVVDDSLEFGPLLEVFLKKAGHETTFACDGTEALAKAGGADVVLLDMHLPDIDGSEVFRRLRADPRTKELPVIFVSGDNTEAPDGARTGRLRKPFEPARLVSLIKELLTP